MSGKGDTYRPVNQKKWDEGYNKAFPKLFKTFVRPVGHTCMTSSGIHEGITFGTGELNDYGYWEQPCLECARAWEEQYPEYGPAWPFDSEYLERPDEFLKKLREKAENQ
jgi:hypothetical protein